MNKFTKVFCIAASVLTFVAACYFAQQKFYPVVILTPTEAANVAAYVQHLQNTIEVLAYTCTPAQPA